MISPSEIHRLTYENVLRDGRRLFQNGSVRHLEILWPEDGENGNTRAEGDFSDRGGEVRSSLVISPDDEILDYRCTCVESEMNWGMCRHCAALAFAFQSEQKKRRRTAVLGSPGLHRETTEALSKVLYQYSVRGRMNRMGGPDGEICLEFSFQPDRDGLLLEARIGKKRMYVVKNLIRLVRDVEEMRTVRYGANLEFIHDLSAFDERSREGFALLERAVVSRFPDYMNSYYEASANYRCLLLRGEMLERFLDYYLGGEIRLSEQDMPVREGDPHLTITLKETLGGAELSSEYMDIYTGVSTTFVQKDNIVWKCTPDFAARVLPLWRVIMRRRSGRQAAVFLSRDDYGSFCGNILPALRPYVTVESGKLDLEAFVPAEPAFSVFLSMPEDSVIEVSARVGYEDQFYDLLEENSGGASGRDPVWESMVRQLVRKYFPAENPAGAQEDLPARRHRRTGEWLCGLPVRDLDEETAESGRETSSRRRSRFADEDGVPVRDLDEEMPDSPDPEDSSLAAGLRHRYACGGEQIFTLLDQGIAELEQAAELFVDDTIRNLKIRRSPRVSMGVSVSGDLLQVTLDADHLEAEDLTGILDSYRRRKKYFRLKNGDFLKLTGEGIETLAELSGGLQLSGAELASGSVELPMYRALFLDNVLRDLEIQNVRSAEYRRLVRRLREYRDSDYDVPAALAAKLRRYQREGFRWLCTLYEYGFGGILADDMGLGKTVQILAQQLYVRRGGEKKSTLIAAPASLLYNWESEAGRFTPDLSVQVIAGTAEERQQQIAAAGEYDLNITSYDLLKRDSEFYSGVTFDTCIIDEAQYIKNAGTQAARAVKQIRAAHRFALTGTPVENRLSDLWSIFDFLMPGYLYTYPVFREELEGPAVREQPDNPALKRLARLVTPFLLRRKKSDVLKDLPEKLEEAVYVRMTEEQEKVYRANLERIRKEFLDTSGRDPARDQIQILAELTRLRQLCCSPELVYENYAGGSGKTDTCLELLNSAVDGGHRVLVFSQFTTMLELLKRKWGESGQTSLYLSGRDSKQRRRDMVESFQRGEAPVFFISLKAGGTGLNLTAADIVIHVDPWWNAAAENQASDRAHRIGQKHVVSVMKLVARDTIEEKILQLQERKTRLADSVMEGDGVSDIRLNREELLEVLSM